MYRKYIKKYVQINIEIHKEKYYHLINPGHNSVDAGIGNKSDGYAPTDYLRERKSQFVPFKRW